jgi:hypothetical protein
MTNEEIIIKSDTVVKDCDCTGCQSMCRTPCLGTPEDIVNLVKAGYVDRIAVTDWATGIIWGTHKKMVPMIQPRLDTETGFCTFFERQTGHCQLHDIGLKPLEGKLAYHESRKYTMETIKNSPVLLIVSEWEQIENLTNEILCQKQN